MDDEFDHICKNRALSQKAKSVVRKIARKHQQMKVLQGVIAHLEEDVRDLLPSVPMIVARVIKPFATYDINDEIIFTWSTSKNLPTGGGYQSHKRVIYDDVSPNLEVIEIVD